MKKKIQKLTKKIIPLIFIEIIRIYVEEKEKEKENESKDEEEIKVEDEKEEKIDLKELKDYIFSEFVEKLESQNDIDNILKLIECIEGKQKEKKRKRK